MIRASLEYMPLKIVSAYYGPNGLDYSIGRVNMGGCDFSVRPYTYADTEGDFNLDTFALQEEDLIHKVSHSMPKGLMWKRILF